MYRPLNRKEGLLRTNSICPSPEYLLLELVLQNDRDKIIRLVENNPALLNHIYTPEYNKPILLIACSEEKVEAETIGTLIDQGADLRFADDEEWEAIHFAAMKTDSRLLKLIIDRLRTPGDINALAKGKNALHVLIQHGKGEESIPEFIDCAKILVEGGINVNQADNKLMSPILWAAKKSYKDVIRVILENSAVPVDLDTHQSRNRTARDLILSGNLYDGILPEKIEYSNESDIQILFKTLHQENENAFVNYKNGDIFDLVDSDNESTTLLQLCCNKGLRKSAAHLINKGANPNLTTPRCKESPIQIVAENGYHEIFKLLVDHPKIEMPKKLLILLLRYYENEKFPNIDHAECYNYLLTKLEFNKGLLDINELDESNNSPLHYAIRYADSEKVQELLDRGASLGTKNRYGVMPIQDMDPEILEKHLDKCVQFNIKGKKFDKEDFCVTFKYRTLVPPMNKSELNVSYDSNDSEANFGQFINQELVAETEVISFMSRASEFKHLLKHPVIVSFLFMKWHKIRWMFYVNLVFYIAFFTSLVIYIFSSYAYFDESAKPQIARLIISLVWTVLLVTYFLLFFRELFQIAVYPGKYFKNFENYIEIILIFITGAILFINNPTDDTRKQLSSVSILLAAFELVLMLGQHPKLSTNVVMFRTVSFNFFKFLAWYSLLIVAFALSFYILFTETVSNPQNTTASEDNKEEEEDFFTDPGMSVFKTIVMLTGEFDASSINFHHFPLTSKIIFSLFIFMIAIVLLNLLNGLAVSDTQLIKNDAELVGHIARAQHIRYVESMLLGNILPKNIMNKINKLCCCFPLVSEWNFTLLKPLAKACMFPQILNYEMSIYPNRKGQVAAYGKNNLCGKFCFGSCSSIYVDKSTIKRTNNIIQARREEFRVKQEYIYLQKIEEIIKNIENTASAEKVEMMLLNKKLDNILQFLTQTVID